jgi:hypothetical protein
MRYLILLLILLPTIANAAVYLDGSTSGCSNGSTNYHPATRTCSGGTDQTVSLTPSDFSTRLVAGATNYIRSGDYVWNNVDGALYISSSKSGTAGAYTIVKAYPGEERQCRFTTTSFNYDSKDYPGLEIYGANYVTVSGVKIYGTTLLLQAHDVIVQDSDLGGCGWNYQGQAVRPQEGYNYTIRNNYIHDSCYGESDENGSALMAYAASFLAEYNTFEDNWNSDIRNKDSTNQGSRTTEIRNNLFLPTKGGGENVGVKGIGNAGAGQNALAYFLVHNNVFLDKGPAVDPRVAITGTTRIYNNTIVRSNPGILSGVNIESYNNLFYQTSSGYPLELDTLGILTSDYNLYYQTSGTMTWRVNSSSVATTLAGWKTYSSRDAASISSNPNFVNAAGTASAADFKRSSYAENFTGSSYGTYAGAYETGSEQIGYSWTGVTDGAVYLDGSATGCTSGATNYDPYTRTCGSGFNTVSLTLADFNTRMVAGATNYIRAGSYYRNSSDGALYLSSSKSGSSGSPTIVKAYTGEERQVYIGTASDRMQLNPDKSVNNYYANAAVIIAGNYQTLDGITTYGQTLVFDNVGGGQLTNPHIINCDLGGGGPFNGWGHVLFVQNTTGLLVQNNYIHHACYSSEANTHKSTVNTYSSINGVYEYNTFADGYEGPDLSIGDGATNGAAMIIRNNLFLDPPSGTLGGVHGNGQGVTGPLQGVQVYNNIFLADQGIDIGMPYSGAWIIYNNTFVNGPDLTLLGGYSGCIFENNLVYLGSTGNFISPDAGVFTLNYNLYYIASGTGSWRTGSDPSTVRATTLSGWRSYTGQEANSVSSNPNLVNVSNCLAGTLSGCKRSSYAENFTGSSYGTYAGAYETGSEQIGYSWEASGDITAPTQSITTSSPQSISSDNLTITGTASDDTGVTGVKYRIGAEPDATHGTACTGTTSWSCATFGYSSGSNTVYVEAYDAAGNYSSGHSIIVNYSPTDSTPPTITAFTMPSTASSLTVNVSSFTATDNTAVTGYCITTTNSSSGCSWGGSAPTTATASSSGAVTWYAWARDAALNVSNASTQSTTITLPNVNLSNISTILSVGSVIIKSPAINLMVTSTRN